MKNQTRQSQSEDVKIEEIIDSFSRYAIRDIRVNIENPIAAFILASCLIDQLAAFRYNHPRHKNGEHYKEFIKEYLPHYNPLDIYNNLRGLLVHGYSISENFAIQNEPIGDDEQGKNVNILNINFFLRQLEIAFDAFSNDLRNKQEIRKNALNRYDSAPPLIQTGRQDWQYSEDAADYLISYYSSLLIGKTMNQQQSLKINSIQKFKVGEIFVVKCVSTVNNRDYEADLDKITQQHDLPYPTDVLKEANLF